MRDKRQNRTAELRKFLNLQLATQIYPAGSALPSVRMFAKKFSLCYNAALRVVQEFCVSGQLESVPRRGFFVKKSEFAAEREVGVILPEQVVSGGIIETAYRAIEKHARQLGYPVKSIRTPGRFELPRTCLNAIHKLGAGVLLGEYDLRNLRGLPGGVPLAGVLLHDDFSGNISTVELDPFQSAKFAVEYFREKGVREVLIFSADFPVNLTRCRIFEYLWQAAGGTSRFVEIDSDPYQAEDLLRPGVGCFFGEDDHCRGVFREYREATGGDLRDVCAVFSVGGKCVMLEQYPPVPSHVADWKMLGITAFEEAVIRMNNPLRPPRRIYLSGKFVIPEASESESPAGPMKEMNNVP